MNKIVRFEIKPIESDYFVCILVGYNKDEIGLYSGGFTSYELACDKIKSIIENQK